MTVLNVEITDDFDMEKIAESGQCFRWREYGERGYTVQAGGRLLVINPISPHRYQVSCTQTEWEDFWRCYFDLGTDYSSVRALIDREKDPYLFRASEAGKGIRILRQDPWETLVSFIISQRKSIPAIRTCIEKLSAAAGRDLEETVDGTRCYAFPTPEELAALSEEQLSACGLGYRTKYIADVSARASDGRLNFADMSLSGDGELMSSLMELPGVGIKVASCVMLFGFHRLNLFPKDVWINRVLEEQYPDGFPFDRYAPYCGVMQQYLFYYRRQESPHRRTS